MNSAPSQRGGFTLIELAVSVMIVGILAGVAVPAIQYAILKADAAHMAADAHTISLAATEYLNENGSYPQSAGYGMVPPQMASHLPDGFEFSYKGTTYAWFSLSFPNSNNYWGTRSLGILIFNYSTRPEMADPMYSYYGTNAYWSPTYFYFIYGA